MQIRDAAAVSDYLSAVMELCSLHLSLSFLLAMQPQGTITASYILFTSANKVMFSSTSVGFVLFFCFFCLSVSRITQKPRGLEGRSASQSALSCSK